MHERVADRVGGIEQAKECMNRDRSRLFQPLEDVPTDRGIRDYRKIDRIKMIM